MRAHRSAAPTLASNPFVPQVISHMPPPSAVRVHNMDARVARQAAISAAAVAEYRAAKTMPEVDMLKTISEKICAAITRHGQLTNAELSIMLKYPHSSIARRTLAMCMLGLLTAARNDPSSTTKHFSIAPRRGTK